MSRACGCPSALWPRELTCEEPAGARRRTSCAAHAVSQRRGFSTKIARNVSSSITPCSRSTGTTSSNTSVIDQLRIAPLALEHLRGLGRVPVDRGAVILGDHQALGVPAAQELG